MIKSQHSHPGSKRNGAALIITLAFMVLLTATLIIFFTQALSYRLQSNSNFNDFKSAAIGQSALETVVGDLKQEITNGSTAKLEPDNTWLYIPTNNAVAIPQRSGNPVFAANTPDPIPNLVRVSTRSETYPSGVPAIASRASAASSTDASANDQYVSLPRWNKHYLIPRAISGVTTVDTTPTNAFIAPDWVFVTREEGPAVLASPFKDSGGKAVTPIGRYAYAIYDEGGLLDANVAGVPSTTATNAAYPSGPNPQLLVWGSGNKGSEAFADLTVTNYATGAPILTQPQIDQIVGWRNNATVRPTGNFGAFSGNPLVASGYSFTSSGALKYHDAMVLNTNGFLVTSGQSYTDPTSGLTDTDQLFANRQALIAFFIAAGLPQDALQYLATFTRDVEQPIYNPSVGRPMVQDSTNMASSTGNNAPPFGSGNDAYSHDRASTSTNSPADINPPMLAVRVAAGGWQRADGTTAQSGEPLIKERFPLSRLGLFPINEGTVSGAVATKIYQYFGLTQVSPGVWQYNHDPANPGGIDRLSTVATLQREPDFFELLKAAINTGSIGKGSWLYSNSYAWNSGGWNSYTSGNQQQMRDTLTAVQILQIGANIIDQAKPDDFPTRIQCTGLPSVCGVEDLPYLYRFRFWLMEMPGPTSQGAGAVQGQLLLLPELWNPHAPTSSALLSGNNMPRNFRIRVLQDPSANAAPITATAIYGKGKTATTYQSSNISNDNITNGPTGYYDGITLNAPNYSAANVPAPLTFNAGAANGYWDFREPTLLAQPGIPVGSNLAGGSPGQNLTGPTGAPPVITGLQAAVFYWYYQSYFYATNPSLYFNELDLGSTGLNSCIRFYLDYQDASAPGGWVTYDQQQYQCDAIQLNFGTTPSSFVTTEGWGGGGRVDPRTSRWGFHIAEYLTSIPAVNAAADVFATYRPNGGISYGDHVGGRADIGFVGASSSYGSGINDPYLGFQNGYWAENSVLQTYQSDGAPATAHLRYNLDPDGVARRTMGGYVTDPSNGGTTISANQPLTGLPMATGATTTSGNDTAYDSRPTILHRPFRSVAELGYVFRDTPWADINFSFPESGDSALLDVFCIDEVNSASPIPGMVAGRVNLNTRQAPVLAALMSKTVLDKDDPNIPVLTQTMASDLANRLVARTSAGTLTSTTGTLMSRADLVGTWMGSSSPTTSGANLKTAATLSTNSSYPPPYPPLPPISPDNFYTGFSHDIGTTNVPSVFSPVGVGSPNPVALIPRQRTSVMRGLIDSGTTRMWNLMIDLVAQSGRFAPNTSNLANFVVEGEKHYWLHVAIDRYTGKIIDSQLEVVKE